ncbi:hypothetical protein [Aquimarina sp. RZ0]|uniref:hypothetical protein n=1 Tax=Aquimarina sp. RZ0 TaxID=2607730 RepID=UPI0011F1C784|nr:hypothetical protein [Aquimarina sp. RZ0]KAA1247853.1 hypothetical protein F0000_01140 [Aquimarina sp. RZ0]
MKKIRVLTSIITLVSLGVYSQTDTSNYEKLNLQSPSGVSLFQSSSTNGVWATGTITADRWGLFEDASSSKERITVLAGGNVGIGTNNPDATLAVNGNIHTKEVKVDLNGWPDYVFEDDYKLPTLQQVEDHIIEKGHLENIPSAAEVTENGIQLGEMNAKLLQKIEELTLYMIEQNKKTEALKIIVTAQQKEIESLKKNTK